MVGLGVGWRGGLRVRVRAWRSGCEGEGAHPGDAPVIGQDNVHGSEQEDAELVRQLAWWGRS